MSKRTIDKPPSGDVAALNPHLYGTGAAVAAGAKPMKMRLDKSDLYKMTGPERVFNAVLEADKRCGRIRDFKPWGLKLRWGGNMTYSPDFVIEGEGKLRVVEIKGKRFFPKDVIRFKGCREEWKHLFDFELFQVVDGEPKRIL